MTDQPIAETPAAESVHPGWADVDPAFAEAPPADAASGGEGGAPAVPDVYALNLPDELSGRVEVSPDHPLYAPASDWARKWGLPQQAFDELVAIQAGHEAGGGIDSAAERTKLLAAFNDNGRLNEAQAQARADEVGRWAVGLLGPDVRRHRGLANELMMLTATADGVALLRAIKSRVGEARPPKAGHAGGGSAAVSTEEFYRELFRGGRG